MKITIMKCGHVPNAKTSDGKPCCAICAGFTPDAYIAEEVEVDLSKRQCRCTMCGKIVPSDKHIAFFEYKPNEKYDSHYDGCFGWN